MNFYFRSLTFGLMLILVSSIGVFLYVSFHGCSCEVSSTSKYDVMVLLGGGEEDRSAVAADLYNSGISKSILITGDGDCYLNASRLASKGVDVNALAMECASKSTWENALNSIKILRSKKVRSVVLVTSWYHMPRALYTFRYVAPDMEWHIAITSTSVGDVHFFVSEYFKMMGYIIFRRLKVF